MIHAVRAALSTTLVSLCWAFALLPSAGHAADGAPNHPLLQKIYDTGVKNFVDDAAFKAALAENSIVILGEVHDNPGHHVLRAALLESLRQSHDRPRALVFEQLRSDQQEGLERFAGLNDDSKQPATLADFKRLTNWDKSGWVTYRYDPLLQAAIDSKLPIYSGDVTRADIRKAAKEGSSSVPADEQKRLALDVPLGEANDAASIGQIEEAHCQMLPAAASVPMAFAQRYRDAHIADAVLKAAAADGSVMLFAGNEHARSDRGVPWYLRQRSPETAVLTVMPVEVQEGNTDPESYVEHGPDGKPAADYIIFTPRAEHEDQCEKMRLNMKK